MSAAPKEAADWPAIRDWRRRMRAGLIERRAGQDRARRRSATAAIAATLARAFPTLGREALGFYWPFKGEVDLRSFVADRVGPDGGPAALPVVVERASPVEFWRWTPGAPLDRGIWDIPIPAARQPVQPSVLLIPLVGFDRAGFRLGHGGGYYDRTLATFSPKPFCIGIGYAFQSLPTIHPQPHDIAMDCIVTEAGLHRAETGATSP